jgi:hypothetical protein
MMYIDQRGNNKKETQMKVGDRAVERMEIATGRDQLMVELMKRIGSLDMTDSGKALDALLEGIQKTQREVRMEKTDAEAAVIRALGS